MFMHRFWKTLLLSLGQIFGSKITPGTSFCNCVVQVLPRGWVTLNSSGSRMQQSVIGEAGINPSHILSFLHLVFIEHLLGVCTVLNTEDSEMAETRDPSFWCLVGSGLFLIYQLNSPGSVSTSAREVKWWQAPSFYSSYKHWILKIKHLTTLEIIQKQTHYRRGLISKN